MLTIKHGNPVVVWPVTVSVPRDGGSFEKSQFRAKFEILNSDQVNAMAVDHRSSGDQDTDLGQLILTKSIKDLFDLVDEDGNQIPYTDELRDQVLAIPYIKGGLWEAYTSALNGRRQKN